MRYCILQIYKKNSEKTTGRLVGEPARNVQSNNVLVRVLSQDFLDVLGNQAAVGLAVDGHDRSQTAGAHAILEASNYRTITSSI